MGFRFSLLFAAPLLLAAPALAQQDNGAEPVFNLPRTPAQPRTDPNAQGPELDVFRGAPTPATPPPVVAPTIQLPPIAAPVPTPAPAQNQPVQRSAEPVRPPQAAPQSQAPAESAVPGEAASPPPPAADQDLPSADNGTVSSPTPVSPSPPEPPAAPAWPWIAAAAAAAMLLIGAYSWLRRRRQDAAEEPPYEAEAEADTAPPPPPPPPSATPAPPEPEAAPDDADRPWIELAMDVQAARLTLLGATIGYRLTLRNRGTRAAEDILVRSLITNADAQQQALFQSFFAGETGLPVHSVVSIAPGETQKLSGEMRLDAQAIAAIPMGQRALLIPLIAFDAHYRWTGESEGTGRSGGVFIVGEEQSPPAERLSPFRLDLGPRQYRAPGSRATALSLSS
ncbi:hypothetical protein EWH08_11535 [Sphingobium indicum]|uniref:Uncharacterized protein n=2 Tax=Sphingobium indicum TaxID=332055 RepID=A0A1L5BPN5_SPHIB|nr:hypothetical protein [Sphingobium indicum]APL94874.1 hypothetical protein SIDU_10320 [Sphingobium indicum B90A]NYI22986.1 hypothetical protein [Sphingobium indicum]RYM01931.1 hypothetical protein EWH08_11535 [Sphingobium indicum]